MRERNLSIDVMRVLGLLLIILAHVSPPGIIFQLRIFDVPMMVFVSGMSYFAAGKKDVNIIPYVYSRFKRLVVPVWCFLIVFFSFIFVFTPRGFDNLIDPEMIISSFALNGFGYLWVIRVFLIIAILSPFYVLVADKIKGVAVPAVIIFLLLLSTLISVCIKNADYSLINLCFSDYIIPALSYGTAFVLGYSYVRASEKDMILSFFVFLAALILCALIQFSWGSGFRWPQESKYPPTMYYILYSLTISIPLYLFVKYKLVENINGRYKEALLFLSSNTIWVYLWHIPVVEYYHRLHPNVNFIFKYIPAVLIPVLVVTVQVKMVKKLISKNPAKYGFLKVIFTG